jgi:hypothetical protein
MSNVSSSPNIQKNAKSRASLPDLPVGLQQLCFRDGQRPPSGYLLFCEAHRSEVKAKMTDAGKVTRELFRMWRAEAVLTGERDRWIAIARRAKAYYKKKAKQAN